MAKGLEKGETVVEATYIGLSDKVELVVNKKKAKQSKRLKSLYVTPKKDRIKVGGTQQYKAIAEYTDGSTRNVTDEADWTIYDKDIAGISKGLAIGNKEGETKVKAIWKGESDTAELIVEDTSPSVENLDPSDFIARYPGYMPIEESIVKITPEERYILTSNAPEKVREAQGKGLCLPILLMYHSGQLQPLQLQKNRASW